MTAIEKAGYRPGEDVFLGLDCASSEFYVDGTYRLSTGAVLSSASWSDYLLSCASRYPIISIEDGMAEDDWDGWRLLTDRLGRRYNWSGTIYL